MRSEVTVDNLVGLMVGTNIWAGVNDGERDHLSRWVSFMVEQQFGTKAIRVIVDSWFATRREGNESDLVENIRIDV